MSSASSSSASSAEEGEAEEGLYCTDHDSKKIIYIKNFGQTTQSLSSGNQQIPGLNAIAVYEGWIFVTADGAGGNPACVMRLRGLDDTNPISYSGPDGDKFGTRLRDIAIGPDGKIYVVDVFKNRIVRMDDLSGTGWTTCEKKKGVFFNTPVGISVNSSNIIVVADTDNGRLLRFTDMSNDEAEQVPFGGNTAYSSHLFRDGSGYCLNYNTNNPDLYKWSSWAFYSPTLVRSLSQFDSSESFSLSGTKDGNLYISGSGSGGGMIQQYNGATGTFEKQYGPEPTFKPKDVFFYED